MYKDSPGTRLDEMSDVRQLPILAASVMLIRQENKDLEMLFLRRNPQLVFQGNYWVFPGGRIENTDTDPTATPANTEEATAKRAAVREAYEEAGIDLSGSMLTYAAHWTTPTNSPIRYATWFFVASAPTKDITVDGSEIEEHRWLRPAVALEQQHLGNMQMAAPTFALTTRLSVFDDVNTAIAASAAWPKIRLLAEVRKVEGGIVALYQQDAAHGGKTLDRPGPRHRLWMISPGWKYEYDY